ncbi:hypothetical protein [Sphingobium fluviale]|uniref:Sulfotransferase n=1 Tax=Sphingobium fluviale TaxID=2506423 RepID=A0A4Q1KL98_9SPHN|nr:hypothetical protein [Sphingobium fluviale]RXR29909.1 hypothetical protein EQG66_05060 [Sphingobium fluviale]
MADPATPVLFADAMWRSGSTYLASRFAQSGRYLLFYEPCHEGVGRKPTAARDRDRSRTRDLRHPELEGGYFGTYERLDPLSGQPLRTLHAPDMAVRNVYDEGSDAAVDFLSALVRVARAEGKIAFLGFCRSGTQTARLRALLGGQGLHLWRDPRAQFASYGWPGNDYFMAGTLLQLSFSGRYAALAAALAPEAARALRLRLARLLPDRRTRDRYRLVRPVAAQMTAEQSYALFYLSWLLSYRSGVAGHALSFSLTQLSEDAAMRQRVTDAFGISFPDLRPTPDRVTEGIDYDAVEQDVSRRLDALSGTPSSASEYPPRAFSAA